MCQVNQPVISISFRVGRNSSLGVAPSVGRGLEPPLAPGPPGNQSRQFPSPLRGLTGGIQSRPLGMRTRARSTLQPTIPGTQASFCSSLRGASSRLSAESQKVRDVITVTIYGQSLGRVAVPCAIALYHTKRNAS
jgi:hypothetical protein